MWLSPKNGQYSFFLARINFEIYIIFCTLFDKVVISLGIAAYLSPFFPQHI